MADSTFDVFVSYRRAGGSDLATVVREALQRQGLRVFLDVEDMPPGRFEDSASKAIDGARDVIVILTPGCFARREQTDHFLQEIEHALARGKNIVPVVSADHSGQLRKELPPPFEELRKLHWHPYSHTYRSESLGRLRKLLVSRPSRSRRAPALILTLAAGATAWTLSPRDGAEPRDSVEAVLRPLGFHWTGFGQGIRAGQDESFVVRDGMTAYSGDQFQLCIEPTENCYLYVLGTTSSGVDVLFPPHGEPDHLCRQGFQYEIPGSHWLTLDDQVGEETIFIVASYDPVSDLELLLDKDRTALERPTVLVKATVERLEAVKMGEARTRSGASVDLRGISVQPDRRTAETVLDSGRRLENVMEFVQGTVHAVKRISLQHMDPP